MDKFLIGLILTREFHAKLLADNTSLFFVVNNIKATGDELINNSERINQRAAGKKLKK